MSLKYFLSERISQKELKVKRCVSLLVVSHLLVVCSAPFRWPQALLVVPITISHLLNTSRYISTIKIELFM